MATTDWPKRIDICPWGNWYSVHEVTGSASGRSQDSTYLSGGNFGSGGGPSVAGWYVEYKVPLAAGTWAVTLIITTVSHRGIFDTKLDGVNIISGTDAYSAGLVTNVVVDTTGIVIAASSVKTLRFEVTGKNASSSAYSWGAQWLTFRRTA